MDKNLLNIVSQIFKFFFVTLIFIFLFLIDVSFIKDGPFFYLNYISLSLLFFIFFILKKNYYQFIFAILFGIFVDWNNLGFLGFSSLLFLFLVILYSFINKYLPNKFFSYLLIDLFIYLLGAIIYSYFVISLFLDLVLSGIVFSFIYNVFKYFFAML